MRPRALALLSLVIVLGVFVSGGCAPEEIVYQRGDIAIVDGHELYRYPIYVLGPLSPGRHDLGSLQLPKTDARIDVAVEVDSNGTVSDILLTGWPSEVEVETLSVTTHDVYYVAPGGSLTKSAKKAKCVRLHASGQCLFCSTHLWIEVLELTLE